MGNRLLRNSKWFLFYMLKRYLNNDSPDYIKLTTNSTKTYICDCFAGFGICAIAYNYAVCTFTWCERGSAFMMFDGSKILADETIITEFDKNGIATINPYKWILINYAKILIGGPCIYNPNLTVW